MAYFSCSTLQGEQPDSQAIVSLRKASDEAGKQLGGWLADELLGRFDGTPADPCDGFDAAADAHATVVR